LPTPDSPLLKFAAKKEAPSLHNTATFAQQEKCALFISLCQNNFRAFAAHLQPKECKGVFHLPFGSGSACLRFILQNVGRPITNSVRGHFLKEKIVGCKMRAAERLKGLPIKAFIIVL